MEGKCLAYPLQHSLQILHHIIVPETQHQITLATQPCIPLFIICRLFGMLPAVQFDNEISFHADKIHNVTTYGFLPLEFQAHEAVRAQVIPQSLFGFGLVGAEGFGVV